MTVWLVVGAVALLLANGFFVWAEFAFIAARRTRIEELARDGRRTARVALGSMQDLNGVLAGAQLGITMASLGLGFVGEAAAAELLHAPLEDLPGGVSTAIEIVVGLGVVVAAHMVLGEMVPKNLAIAQPERSALWLAIPFRVYTTAFRPLIGFLNVIANGLVRSLGVEPRDELVAAHSADEIAHMLDASREDGVIEAFDHGLLERTLSFDRLDARAVMVPRPDVVTLPYDATPDEVERLVAETGHSRLPLYRGTFDDVVGFVHVKDVLVLEGPERDAPVPTGAIRPMLVVPESRTLPDLLDDMRRGRNHFAVVVDEHGGVEGVVTLEDVLEELVGEIRDEHDRGEARVWRVGSRRFLVDAGLRPDEVARDVGLVVPDGDYETIAGYVLSRLGRVPEPGDEFDVSGWRVRVRRMRGRRVDLVEVVAPPASTLPAGAPDAESGRADGAGSVEPESSG